MEDKIFNLICEQDEIAWKAILYELVKAEGMDPWNIDVSELTQRFLVVVKKLKELDLQISGKMILAAALLVKLKSDKFMGEDLSDFDRLFEEPEEDSIFDDEDDYGREQYERFKKVKRPLIPRTPQPRKRKVSIYDLVNALDKALTVKRRRVLREMSYEEISIPDKGVNITDLIDNVYKRIKRHLTLKKKSKVRFKDLVPSRSKTDMVYTFIPILHLSQLRRVDLEQQEAFADIFILPTKNQKDLEKSELASLDIPESES